MPSEEKTPTQKEIEMQAIEEIGKQITDYFLYVVKHMKFDENGNPIATSELKEYMENERKKFKERSKVFSNKAFSEYLQQHISKSLSESEEWAAACARAKEEAKKQVKTEQELKRFSDFLFTRRTDDLDSVLAITMPDFRNVSEMKHNDGSLKIKKNEHVIKLDEFDKVVQYAIGTSTKKLAYQIFTLGSELGKGKTEIKLNIYDYAELNGIELKNQKQKDNFCMKIRQDLQILKRLSPKTKRGGETSIIGRFEPLDNNGNYVIEMLQSTIDELRAAYSAGIYYPKCLYKHNDKSTNAFSIGVQLNTFFFRNNKPYNTVISVKKLLEYAPELATCEEYEATGRKHWKADLKDKLEKALDENIQVGFLKSWIYKASGRNGKLYSKEEVQKMTFKEYKELMIKFTPANLPKK